jgi:long-chain acyl-CoA synthetase
MLRISNEVHFNNRIVPCFNKRRQNFWEFFLNNTKKYPNNIALSDGKKKISYIEIYNYVLKKSKYLKKIGFNKGDRACVLFENSWPLIVCILAGIKDGIIIVPLNPKSSVIENELIINDCSAKGFFFDKKLIENIPSKEKIKSVESLEFFDESKYFDLENQFSNFKSIVEEEDVAFILYTSGTTGKPKGAMITHFNIIHSCYHYTRHFNLNEKDNCILVVPASHVTGLVAHIMTTLFSGGHLILMESFNVKEFLSLAEKEKLSFLIMVPAMYNLCIHRGNISEYNLSNWRIGCFGGAPMPTGTIKKLKKILPNLLLINAYGSTETCSPATLMPLFYKNNMIASVGKVVETGKILVMDEQGHEVETGNHGELWISGPMVIPGYWKDDLKTNEEFIGGYWKSGDVGYIDASGYIYILDRKKDVINRGGYKIYSSEIENLLSLSGLVIETAAVPYKDPILGEKIHVIVYSSQGEKNLDKLKMICSNNIAEYKQPDYWTFLNKELPKNKNGKIIKAKIIQEMRNKF